MIEKQQSKKKYDEILSLTPNKKSDIKNTNIVQIPIGQTPEKNIIVEKLNKEVASEKIKNKKIKNVLEDVMYEANNQIEQLQSKVTEKEIIIEKFNKEITSE
ncbi:MAG: hypothetical protein KAH72_07100, partial [Flavobacteriaceae bacterium]|nr:hypothetical protein [Flavobacteriaceae bacterium]